MLLSILPLPIKHPPITPRHHAMAILPIGGVIARVVAPVRPTELAHAFHAVRGPLAVVFATVFPDVEAEAVDPVVLEFSVKDTPIRENEDSSTMSLAIQEVSLET